MLKDIDLSKAKIITDKIGRIYTTDEQAEKTPNDIEREASRMCEKETLSIGEEFILNEIRCLNRPFVRYKRKAR